MTTSSRITSFLFNRFWPFFRKYIWPLIQEEVIKSFKHTIRIFSEKYEDLLRHNTVKQNQAQAQAQAAEAQAANATNSTDADKYRAVAEVWRQVAEDLREENEKLKAEREGFLKQVAGEAERSVKDMQIHINGNQVQLTSGNGVVALPSPRDEPEIST
ncbi:hypothetical protein SE17_01295 [Kouleothrix aurantiaca]|uniref:Uncharacterized protein n=1 Tax=Kouleothrix aurantiaca TaxID=186479 RepID=A0A0P9D764_9CHLR|nr:hypothetical protein SE17_01295 [Kouleothrix aurantiaca]